MTIMELETDRTIRLERFQDCVKMDVGCKTFHLSWDQVEELTGALLTMHEAHLRVFGVDSATQERLNKKVFRVTTDG